MGTKLSNWGENKEYWYFMVARSDYLYYNLESGKEELWLEKGGNIVRVGSQAKEVRCFLVYIYKISLSCREFLELQNIISN